MTYRVMHLDGGMERGFPVSRFAELLDELAHADEEQPNVSVIHESEWCLGAYRHGMVVLENIEDGDPFHAGPLERDEILRLMATIADGRIEEARARVHEPGYPLERRDV